LEQQKIQVLCLAPYNRKPAIYTGDIRFSHNEHCSHIIKLFIGLNQCSFSFT